VIEVGTQHCGLYVLICSEEASGALLLQAEDVLQLQNPHKDLLPAYFKQKNIHVDKNVVIVESPKLSTLFAVAQTVLSESDFECIEIQRSIADSGKGVAVFCNGTDLALFQDITSAQVTIVEKPSAAFKYFF